jgi:hypothetical protein
MSIKEKNKLNYFKTTLLIALLLTFLASIKLWHSNRSLPTVAIYNSLPLLPLWLNYALIAIILISILISLFIEKPTVFLIIILVLSSFLILFDLNRLLPPFYMFFSFLFILVMYYKNKITYNTLLTIMRIAIFGIYLASGLCKLNPCFDNVIYQWLIRPLQSVLNEDVFSVVKKCSILIPITEIFIAIGLLLPSTRKIALLCLCVTHVTVLVILSPVFSKPFYIIYPWNISMIVFSFLFFYKAEAFSISCIINSLRNNFVKLFVVLYIVIPFIHLFGFIDTNLAFEVYSGKRKYAILFFSENVYKKLPPDIKAVTRSKNDFQYYSIFLDEWAQADIQSSLYSERRTIKYYKNYIMNLTQCKNKKDVILVVRRNGVDQIVY